MHSRFQASRHMFCNTETHEVRGLPISKESRRVTCSIFSFPGARYQTEYRSGSGTASRRTGDQAVNVRWIALCLRPLVFQPVSHRGACLKHPIPAGTLSFQTLNNRAFLRKLKQLGPTITTCSPVSSFFTSRAKTESAILSNFENHRIAPGPKTSRRWKYQCASAQITASPHRTFRSNGEERA